MYECSPCLRRLSLLVWLSLCVALLDGQPNGEVAVKWGVADGTATVGKLFQMHIPNDAFIGNILSYQVLSSDGSPLPDWIQFDDKDNVLLGVPTPKDAGQLYLEITAQGPTGQATVTSTIFIRDVPSHTSGAPLRFKTSGPEFIHCTEKEPETVATVIVDVDLEALTVPDRLALLRKFISHMGLHEDMVKMMPVGNSPIQDSSALVSGSGDCLTPKTSGLFISWPVGCGQVKEGHFPVLQKLDDDSGSGKMAKVLSHSVIGWRVTNSHFQATIRKRRQVHVTQTPAATPIMPTKTDSKQEETDDGDGKMTHQVVITQSPTFIHPTATQPHMTKTDDIAVVSPDQVDVKDKPGKVIPTEATTKVMPVSRTKELPVIKPTTSFEPSQPTDIPTVAGGFDCMPGQRPEVKFPIERLPYQVGDVIDYVIPEDTFQDCEVGGTRGLDLILFQNITDQIQPDYFLQFDSIKQRIIGLPSEENIGKHKFNLIARKKANMLVTNNEFIVQIRGLRNKKNINHELSVAVDLDFNMFMKNVSQRVSLANKIASVFDDPDAKRLTITKIQEGSVIIAWTNTSLASRDCPADKITGLVRKLVNEDGSLNDNAVERLKPFVMLSADAAPVGTCADDPNFPVVNKPVLPMTPDVDGKGDGMKSTDRPGEGEKIATVETEDGDAKMKGLPTSRPETTTLDESISKEAKDGKDSDDDDDDIWITTVIPAVVIVVILFIALLIACILYRKKRKGKMNMEEQNTFINKGAPVIFPDELEDKPSDVNKPLLVEGSPEPPPEYHRGTSESPERHIGSNYRNNKNMTSSGPDDSITEMPEKPYEPPPPVTASSNNKQPRTTYPQQPYSQPPQILP